MSQQVMKIVWIFFVSCWHYHLSLANDAKEKTWNTYSSRHRYQKSNPLDQSPQFHIPQDPSLYLWEVASDNIEGSVSLYKRDSKNNPNKLIPSGQSLAQGTVVEVKYVTSYNQIQYLGVDVPSQGLTSTSTNVIWISSRYLKIANVKP